MTRLVITATPLLGRWSVTSPARRDRASWPPSPDTLFSALVASAASHGNACHPALRWLETLGCPSIEAAANPPTSNGITTYEPVADRPMWDRTSRQLRHHNSIGDAAPVSWSWTTDDKAHVADLDTIARDITYIGSSRSPVMARAYLTDTPLSGDALVPDETGSEFIRGLGPGRLDYLEAAFQRREPVNPAMTVAYARRCDVQIRSNWAQMIPLRRVSGQALYLDSSVPVTEAVRRAITAHLPDDAPATFTGHAQSGLPLKKTHMSVVPLPHVGNTYADGDLIGVGLLLPEGISDAEYAVFVTGVMKWQAAGGRVDIGRITWKMEIALDDSRVSLRDTRYKRVAQSWSSVTPIVFDRHPRRTLRLTDIVAAMCQDVGLPAPAKISASSTSPLVGTVDSRKHHLGSRDYLNRSFISHLTITWPRKIPGPILLGRGRYFGLGVMLPDKEAA